MIKNYNFVIDFTDKETGEEKTALKGYKALNYERALKGVEQYIRDNKTMINPKIRK